MAISATTLNPTRHRGVDWIEGVLQRLSMPSAPASSEAERGRLIRAIAISAERAAFIALFEFYAPRIKAQTMRFGLDASVAEDIVQDAMLSVWRRAAQFDAARGSASAWIFTIAANARIDRLRRDRAIAGAMALDEHDFAEQAQSQSDSAEAHELNAIVDSLPPEQRRIVLMSFYADVPHGEIASRLGIPLGTVKSRIRLAMARLRQKLGEAP